MLFGPLACTSYGDPYSPFTSTFRPPDYPAGPYTYRYRILIPADYPDDVLRVELFDPDSWNSPIYNATITHTSYAASNGFPSSENMDCYNNGQGIGTDSRQNSCLLVTGEETLVSPPTVTIAQVNPVWFMRVDENRTAQDTCDIPTFYTEFYNTTTVYQLFYHAQSPDGTIQEVSLASYTGLKNNSHNTDLHWVSPGAPPSFDYPGPPTGVPADFGSFEIELDTAVPNILVEQDTGNRYIYLDVTTTDGSSKNGFDIWAGPATYTTSVPSHVNTRNIHLLDNPNTHDSAGVVILATNNLPQSAHSGQLIARPLGYFGPEYAGQPLYLRLFDVDVLSQAPITFTFDTIAPADWSLTFGISGTIDPDGVPANSRCFPNCNDQFITPAYTITIPDGINCNAPDCIPFYGGRLLMHYKAGINDNHFVSLTAPPAPPSDTTMGCNALAVTVEEGIRALFPPGTLGGNVYPDPSYFEYPVPPPTYTDFPNNNPDVPLRDAQEGYVYRIQNGLGLGAFSWLRWNTGINDSTTTLANSLLWPGNTSDYLDHGDGGQPATPLFPYVVRGYVNPFDVSDLALHINDWVLVSNSATNNATIQDILNEHIDNGRLLRLVVRGYPPIGQGSNTFLPIKDFGLFRLHGYNIGSSSSWLLVEFIRWDNSCGQLEAEPEPLLGVTITGPVSSTLGTFSPLNFTAAVQPLTATPPITYQWQATAQLPVSHTSGLTDAVDFHWLVPHTYTILVSATNGINTVTDTHQIVIHPALPIPGCASFPIGIQEVNLSVFPPGTGSGHDYPNPGDFHISSPHPLYLQFPNHVPNMPLAEAQEGYIYKVNNGPGDGSMAWLVWNNRINPSSLTLANSLTIPGNSNSYISQGDTTLPATPLYPYTVAGYVNPFDTFDLLLNPGDEITVSTGSVNSASLRDKINEHIAHGYELRLPIWDTVQGQGAGIYVRTVQLAVFRLHGHNLAQSGGPSWLLVEFVRWETGICTEGQYPVGQVHISGPANGTTNLNYDFTAAVAPTMTNQPLTYTWQATEQTPVTQTAGITNTINLSWPTPGPKIITVTAENLYRAVTTVHTITLAAPMPLLSVTITGPITSTLDTFPLPTFTAVAQPLTAAQPITYTWAATAQLPVSHTNGLSDTVSFRWPVPHTYTILITVTNGLSTVTDSHQIVIYPAAPIPGCASFPIAIQSEAVSVNPPDSGSGNDFPLPNEFHPGSPQPLYAQFPNHLPNVPLTNAQAGYIFKLPNGLDTGDKAWLVWNIGINNATSTLVNSLLLPGNSNDYSDHGDGGQPATPIYNHVVRGYVNPFDTSDLRLDSNDWIPVNTGALNSNDLQTVINAHSLNGRELRLIIWDTAQAQGNSSFIHTVQFAIFRLHGHNLTQAGGSSWLLAEFVRWEPGVCTEGQLPPGQVSVTGPHTGTVALDYTFTATVVPTTTIQPLTYTWQTSQQATITHTGDLTDTAVFNWLTPGAKTITVTARNSLGAVTATHLITISQVMSEPVISLDVTGPITGLTEMTYSFTALVTPVTATQPITYTWQATDQSPIIHTGSLTDTINVTWTFTGTKIITATADNGISMPVTAVHTITIAAPPIITNGWHLYLPIVSKP